MKYGICEWCIPVPEDKRLAFLMSSSLDGMEVEYSERLFEKRREYRSFQSASGKELPTIGMNIFDRESYVDPANSSSFADKIKKAVEIAECIQANIIQIPAFFASEIKTQDDLCVAAERMREACFIAQEAGKIIGIENALDEENNQKLFSMVNCDNFRFYFDTLNLFWMKNTDCTAVLETMKDKLCEVHAKEMRILGDNEMWALLGEGNSSFLSTTEQLVGMQYDGWIHMETDYNKMLLGSRQGEEAMREDLNRLKQIFP